MDGPTATETWVFFTFPSIGYMISRGLAKPGSRSPTGTRRRNQGGSWEGRGLYASALAVRSAIAQGET